MNANCFRNLRQAVPVHDVRAHHLFVSFGFCQRCS